MRTLTRLALLTVLVGGTVAGAASAAPQIGAIGARSFKVSVTAPQTIQRGDLATFTLTVINQTDANLVANPKWVLTGPFPATPAFGGHGSLSFTVPAFATVTRSVTFKVPLWVPVGSYHLTVTLVGADAPATADFAIT